LIYYLFYLFFFFSSRRRHTRSKRDWSSDVCSSDLITIRIILRFCFFSISPISLYLSFLYPFSLYLSSLFLLFLFELYLLFLVVRSDVRRVVIDFSFLCLICFFLLILLMCCDLYFHV